MADNENRNRIGADDRAMNNADGDMSEAVGTVGGGAAGAAVGSVFGPLGTIAGAVVGGTLGNQAGEGVDTTNNEDRAE